MDGFRQPRQSTLLERCLTPDSSVSEVVVPSGITMKTAANISSSEDDLPQRQLNTNVRSPCSAYNHRQEVLTHRRRLVHSQRGRRKQSISTPDHSPAENQGSPIARSPYRSPPPSPNPSLHLVTWGGVEEIEALESWRARTAPWLTWFIDPQVSDFWKSVVPQIAHELPATKHILIAVALLDMRLTQSDACAVKNRSKAIMRHYHEAITLLTVSNAITLDAIVAAILAYALETLALNASTALMHLRACGSMTRRRIKTKAGTIEEQQITKDLEISVACCLGYADSTRSFLSSADPPRTVSVVRVLNARHAPLTAANLTTCIRDFEMFSHNFHMQQNTGFKGFDKHNTVGYFRYWEMALIKLRDDQKVPQITLIAAQLLLIIGLSLLPQAENGEDFPGSESDPLWFGYYLARIQPMTQTCDLNARGREQLEKVIATGLKSILKFAKEPKHIKESQVLLEKIGYG